jgi:hypothetical protein
MRSVISRATLLGWVHDGMTEEMNLENRFMVLANRLAITIAMLTPLTLRTND